MWQYNHSQPNELMHYGKKGMKWGKRKAKVASIAKSIGPRYMKAVKKHESTHDERQARYEKGVKTATKIASAATIAVGAATAVKYLAMYGNLKSQVNAKNASTLIQIGESFVDFVVS